MDVAKKPPSKYMFLVKKAYVLVQKQTSTNWTVLLSPHLLSKSSNQTSFI